MVDIKINFAVCAVNGWRGGTRTHDRFLMEAYQTTVLHQLHHSPIKNKMHAINAIYWIRTNVSSIAASALTTKLNARMVDINVTLLYASLKSTRSKWPNHYVRCSTWLSYHQQLLADGIWTHNLRLTMQKWILLYGSFKMVGVEGFEPTFEVISRTSYESRVYKTPSLHSYY